MKIFGQKSQKIQKQKQGVQGLSINHQPNIHKQRELHLLTFQLHIPNQIKNTRFTYRMHCLTG